MTLLLRSAILSILVGGVALCQTPDDEGIPVTDPLVIAKCRSCHAQDVRGNMGRISWERTTPEGWQDVLKRMIGANGVTLTASEARSMVKYLSAKHGLAPGEARPVSYDAERRIHDEAKMGSEKFRKACAKCHGLARILAWRRSLDDWKELASTHAARHKVDPNEEITNFLASSAPLHTAEWTAWIAHERTTDLAGRWLMSAYVPGRGKFYGEMVVEAAGGDEFNTRVQLTSVRDGSSIERSGRSVVYAGYAWRGRSKGSGAAASTPNDLSSEAREVLWIAPDQSQAEGRWFWGQYQEFGFDVKLQRPATGSTLLAVEPSSLKIGSRNNRIRLIGDKIPSQVAAADLNLGPGVSVRRIVSRTPSEVVAEVDITNEAPLGTRDVSLLHSTFPNALAIYDRIDYVKVIPDSAMAAFGNQSRGRGYQQFDAIGYQRGADGKSHTADDVELGPVDVSWSMEIFYAPEGSSTDFVGKIGPGGLFTPAADSPSNNFDVWMIATARGEKDKDGKPLVGKAFLVVTVPSYTFEGRQYVRDLDRWVDDGPVRDRE